MPFLPPFVHPHRAITEPLDEPERVRHEDDRLPAALELRDLVEALVRETLVADGEHLVDEEDVGIDVHGDGEAEAHVHAGRVGLDRGVDELLEPGELDDLVEARVISRFDSPRMMPLRKTFSRPEISGWKPAPSSSSAEMRPRRGRVPLVGFVIPAMSFSSVLLPEPLGPMTPSVSPRCTVKVTLRTAGNVSSGGRRSLVRLRGQQRALQRRELTADRL